MSRVATFVATAGYVGFVPIAPGTFGSAIGLAIYAIVRRADSYAIESLVIVAAFVIGIWSADRVERDLGKDPSAVVIDEVLGMLATVAFLNVTILGAVLGFLIFRFLDVVKPFPARRLEDLHGGPGIMLDDAMAGIYSNLVLRALILFFPGALA